MTGDTHNPADDYAELIDLADAQVNGELDAEGAARLEALLTGDTDAQRVYLRYVHLHAELATGDEAMHVSGWRDRLDGVINAEREIGEVVGDDGGDTRPIVRRRRSWWAMGAGLAAAMVIIAGGIAWLTVAMEWRRGAMQATVATVADGQDLELSETGASVAPGDVVQRGTFRLRQGQARLQFHNGARLNMNGPTLVRLDSDRATTLVSGSISARVPQQAIGFTVTTPSVNVVDLGTDFDVRVDDEGHTIVTVNEGVVVLRPRYRLPRFWWRFDSVAPGDARVVTDEIRKAPGTLQGGARRVAGLVGDGAVAFDNRNGSGVNVGNGSGTSPGTGGFAVTTGITIEAVIAPQWTAQKMDYDEIFRKDDGQHRILLSFQHDTGAGQPMHPGEPRDKGPSLSFGLFLDGVGYSELEAPLDGVAGRPTVAQLTDGKPHHVAATYDAQSGVKALYIDGALVQRYEFAAGAPIVCGGPTHAFIGSTAGGYEPFHGTIDEVAFYDYALTPDEVAAHHANVTLGKSYFDEAPGGAPVVTNDANVPVVTLRAGQTMRFDAVTGLPIGDAQSR